MSKFHSFDFEYDHDYTLIGIHSTLEDFRIAYFLNKNLNIQLNRYKEDLDFTSVNCSFPLFQYEDHVTLTIWSLIANKHVFVSNISSVNGHLFEEESKTSFLISEKKQIDYFIKINGHISQNDLKNILLKINNTPKIITSYTLDPYELKSKDYLIF